MKILVLEGGDSAEREVSLRSAQAVKDALEISGHDTISYDTKQGLDNLKKYREECDVAFPVLHGAGGEDGVVQEALDELGMSYVGAGPAASRLCFDKHIYKQQLEDLGVKSPAGQVVERGSIDGHPLLAKPFVLKPVTGGSSINTHIIRNPADAKLDFDTIFSEDSRMMLEELIEGNEITVSVLGEHSLPVVEIIPPQGAEFNYENKYNGATQELCPPENIPEELQSTAQEIAQLIHVALGVRHLSRTDFMIRGSELFALETNTMPGLTDASLYPKSAAASGVAMPELADTLVRFAAPKAAE